MNHHRQISMHSNKHFYFNLGNGNDNICGLLLGLLNSGKLDLSGDAVEVTTDLTRQSSATSGDLLCQRQTLQCLQLNVSVWSATAVYTESLIIT